MKFWFLIVSSLSLLSAQTQLTVDGLHKPVVVEGGQIRAENAWDQSFTRGFLAARDHMSAMERWRREVEGKLAEVLGTEYVEKDKAARAMNRVSPEGEAFAAGVNAAISMALEQQLAPADLKPEAVWTAKTLSGKAELGRQLIQVKGAAPVVFEVKTATESNAAVPASHGVENLLLYPANEDEAKDPNAAFERVRGFNEESPTVIAWGDFDNDGWPDLFVGYVSGIVKLFRNVHGKFVPLDELRDANFVRAAAWGDFDGDGNLDLYIGFEASATTPNRLYKGDGHGHFVDVAEKMGVNDWGASRQASFVDFNNDGRVDLFVAFREKENRLYRNDGDHFTEVAKQMGISGIRNTVGTVWFDYNEDGRLDLFEASQNGKPNVVWRNDGDHFTEVAHELGMDGGVRSTELGSVSIAVGDFNGDGRLDLYFANYGPSWLMRNDGGGKFTDVAPEMGVSVGRHLVSAAWGDYDNDGRLDLYTDGYLAGHLNVRDYLFHNDGGHFSDATPAYMQKNDADHAVMWVDFDKDGALDLALANHEAGGKLSLYRNKLAPAQARRSLEVMAKAGSEVRVYEAGTRKVLGAALVDTGSGYDSQSALPVHFGLGGDFRKVDVEVTSMSNTGRVVTRMAGVETGKVLVVKVK